MHLSCLTAQDEGAGNTRKNLQFPFLTQKFMYYWSSMSNQRRSFSATRGLSPCCLETKSDFEDKSLTESLGTGVSSVAHNPNSECSKHFFSVQGSVVFASLVSYRGDTNADDKVSQVLHKIYGLHAHVLQLLHADVHACQPRRPTIGACRPAAPRNVLPEAKTTQSHACKTDRQQRYRTYPDLTCSTRSPHARYPA